MPFYERVLHIVRKHVTPVWTRSFPVSKDSTTLGGQLRKKRFSAGLRQSQAALKLGVSNRTLSLWETDRVYPAWAFQPRLTDYLGYNPFTDPALGRPRGNEPSGVAFLSPDAPITVGQKIKDFRLKSRKTRRQLAVEWGISPKMLWGWETGRWLPTMAVKLNIDTIAGRAGSPLPAAACQRTRSGSDDDAHGVTRPTMRVVKCGKGVAPFFIKSVFVFFPFLTVRGF